MLAFGLIAGGLSLLPDALGTGRSRKESALIGVFLFATAFLFGIPAVHALRFLLRSGRPTTATELRPGTAKPLASLDYASSSSRGAMSVRRVLAAFAATFCTCAASLALYFAVTSVGLAISCNIYQDRVSAYRDAVRWGVSFVVLSIPAVRWGRFSLLGPRRA